MAAFATVTEFVTIVIVTAPGSAGIVASAELGIVISKVSPVAIVPPSLFRVSVAEEAVAAVAYVKTAAPGLIAVPPRVSPEVTLSASTALLNVSTKLWESGKAMGVVHWTRS